MENIDIHVPESTPIRQYANESPDIVVLRNFLSDSELSPFVQSISKIRDMMSDWLPRTVGTMNEIKYIAHHEGRYDVWNIAKHIKTPPSMNAFKQKSIGALLLTGNTRTFGKWHRDTVPLWETINNSVLPPFYYNLLVATNEQTEFNGPTQFFVNDVIYWCDLKKGDAVLFNGEVIHRGTPNTSSACHVIFTKPWYNEEIS